MPFFIDGYRFFGPLLLAACCLSPDSASAKGELSPLLKWEPVLSPLPLWDDVLQDPAFAKFRLSTETIRQLSREHTSSLVRPTGDRGKNINRQKQQYTDLLVSYYSKLNKKEAKDEEAIEKLKKWKALLRVWSFHLFENSVDKKEKELYRFHNFLFSFNESEADLSTWFDGNNPVDGRFLEKSRKQLISLVQLLTQLYDTDSRKRNAAIAKLNHISIDLEQRAYILIQLYLARLKAGFDPGGEKVAGSHSGYRYHLRAISDLCKSLSREKNAEILSSVMSIWVSSDDFTDSWFEMPFNAACYKTVYPYQVVLERQALIYYDRNNFNKAYEIYHSILANIVKTPLHKRIEERILEIARKVYQVTGSPGLLHKELLRVVKNMNPKEARPFWKELYHLTMDELNIGLNTKRTLQETEPLAVEYLKSAKKKGEEKRVREVRWTLARLLEKYNEKKKALGQYLILSDSPGQSVQAAALGEAVRILCGLTRWNFQKPWIHGLKADSVDRSQLMVLLGKRFSLVSGREKWNVAKNLTMLMIRQNQEKQAYLMIRPLWHHGIVLQEAAPVMGALISTFDSSGNHQDLETLITVAWNEKITPVFKGRALPLPPLLRKAVRAQAQAFYRQNKFREVVGKADRYLSIFGETHKDYSLMFLKSRAFQKFSEFRQAEKTLAAIFKEGVPEFPEQKNALLNLYKIYKGMGDFNQMLNIAESYLGQYPKAVDIRDEVERICGFYAHKVCRAAPFRDQELSLSARLFESIRESVKTRDKKALGEAEKKLPVTGLQKNVNQELLYYVWYGQLKILSEDRLQRWKSRTTPQSASALKDGYLKLRQIFTDFCQHPENSYCLASRFDLFRFLRSLGSVRLRDGPDKSQWHQFVAEEKSNLLKQVRENSSAGAHSPWVTEKAWWMIGHSLMFLGGNSSGTGFVQLDRKALIPDAL